MPAFLLSFLSSVGSAVLGGAGSLAGGALSLASNLASFLASAAVKAAGFIVGAVVSAISGALRLIISLPGLLFGAARGILGTIFSVAGAVVSIAAKVGLALLGVVGGGLAALGTGFKLAAQAAMDFARDASQLRGATGLSYGQSAGVLRNFGAFGIGGDTVNGTFGQNPSLFGMKAGMYGLPGFQDPDFIPRFAATFKEMMSGGLMGQMRAGSMLDTLGMTDPKFRSMGMLGQGAIQGQLAYSGGINASLGLGPEQIRRYAEEIPLFLGRLSTFWDALKMKVASEALPVLEMGLNAISSAAASNAGGIGQWIENAVQAIFVKIPILAVNGFQSLLGAFQWGVSGFIGIAEMLATGLPKWLGVAVDWVSKILISFADWLAQAGPSIVKGVAGFLAGFGGVFANFLDGMANILEALHDDSNPFRNISLMIASGLDNISMVLKGFVGTIYAIGAMIESALKTSIDSLPFGTLLSNKLGLQLRNPIEAYQQGMATIPSTDLRGIVENFFNSNALPDGAKALHGYANSSRDFFDNASKNVNFYGMNGLSSIVNGANSAANWLAPPGQKNKGEMAGEYAAGHLNGMSQLLRQYVKEPTDNLANWARNYQQSLGNEQQRTERWQEMIAATKGVERAIRETASQNGGGLGTSSEKAAAYMLGSFAKETGAALRRFGG